MDRSDEKQHMDDTDEVSSRAGDVLGLGGSSVPKMPGDPTASSDPTSVRKRRERAFGTDEEGIEREDPYRQGSGATGIDMGAGGSGTDIRSDE